MGQVDGSGQHCSARRVAKNGTIDYLRLAPDSGFLSQASLSHLMRGEILALGMHTGRRFRLVGWFWNPPRRPKMRGRPK